MAWTYSGWSKNDSITCDRGAFPLRLYRRFHSFKLLDEVAYRIVGRDLILLDVEANLVIDSIHEIFPPGI